jgi:hypothetical protein
VKSDVAPEDADALVELGLEIFNASHEKLVVQITLTNQDFSIYSSNLFAL